MRRFGAQVSTSNVFAASCACVVDAGGRFPFEVVDEDRIERRCGGSTKEHDLDLRVCRLPSL